MKVRVGMGRRLLGGQVHDPGDALPDARFVDHVDGLGPLGPRGHDWANLRAMTKAHHSRETAKAQPGGWNDRTS
ncbi:hypothetical protein ABZ554_23285 [Streptomyces sp. NPDC020125]|uniref:hypothetical protein n=1 Tax=unclassified Streptomyces TaxID=2593676 RepID=UPI0033E23F72